MSMKSITAPRLTTWLGCLAVAAVLAAICYFWLDKPIAFFSHDQLKRPQIFVWMQKIPEWFKIGAIVVLIGAGIYSLMGRVLAKPVAVLFLASLSLVTAGAIKDHLKIVFGRYWPDTWTHDNPSLIKSDAYGLHPFQLKPFASWYESFPSGHTTATCAVIAVLWFCWPKLRWLWALIVATVVIGLLGANFHFLGDIVAGGFVGWSVGWIAVRLWEAGGAPSVVPISAPRSALGAPPTAPAPAATGGARETTPA